MTDPQSITDAVSALKKQFPKLQVIAATPSFLTATYQRFPTAHVKVKTTLTFPDGYSAWKPLVVVAIEGGTNVPPGLKRKLETKMGQAAKEHKHAFHQLQAALQTLAEFIDTNHFVPCWKELRQVVELVNKGSQNGDTIRMNESTGLLRLTLNATNKYQTKCSIKIDPEYPNTANPADYGHPCRFKLESSNFPDSVQTCLTQQATELVRRLQDGMPEEHALKMSNPVPLPSTDKPDETPDQAWQRQDLERQKQYGIPSYDGSTPQPSLLALVRFLHSTIHQLPNEKCPSCQETSLPADPKAKTTKTKRPILSHCGHWYHWGCLNTLMNEPPFGIESSCPKCGKALYHPDWSQEAAPERERVFQQRQAREREIADAADFF